MQALLVPFCSHSATSCPSCPLRRNKNLLQDSYMSRNIIFSLVFMYSRWFTPVLCQKRLEFGSTFFLWVDGSKNMHGSKLVPTHQSTRKHPGTNLYQRFFQKIHFISGFRELPGAIMRYQGVALKVSLLQIWLP